MVAQDKTAFVEALEIPREDTKQADKRRRRLATARLQVLQLAFDVRVAEDAVRNIDRALDSAGGLSLPRGGRVRRGARPITERELAAARARLSSKRKELVRKQSRLTRLEGELHDDRDREPPARLFRLHSVDHHIECSERRFYQWSASQRATPIWVTTTNRRRWWWYRDRFWWDDEGLTPEDIVAAVSQLDVEGQQQRETLDQVRADMFRRMHEPDA